MGPMCHNKFRVYVLQCIWKAFSDLLLRYIVPGLNINTVNLVKTILAILC